jgi:hypothetical protein
MSIARPFLPFKIEVTAKRLDTTAHGGLPVVLEAARLVWPKSWYRRLQDALGYESWKVVRRHVESVLLLVAAGGESVDDLKVLAADAGLKQLLGFKLSSPTRVKEFLYRFDQDGKGVRLSREESASKSQQGSAVIRGEGPGLHQLGEMVKEGVRRVQGVRTSEMVTMDTDATLVESSKETALYSYEGSRAYQPMMAWWAEQAVWVGDQFRDGNVGSNTGLLEFVTQVAATLPPSARHRRFRADSAFYNEDMLTWLDENGWKFGVSAMMSGELTQAIQTIPDGGWTPCRPPAPALGQSTPTGNASPADGGADSREIRECAEVPDFIPNWKRTSKKDTRPFRYVAIRVRSRQPDLFVPGKELWRHFAVVTNRHDLTAADLIRWHRAKQGTVEHGHGDLKNELAGGKLPSARFGANAAWWRLNVMCHNLLAFLKSAALPQRMLPMRPKALRFHLFNLPGIVLHHARQTILRISATHPGASVLEAARSALQATWAASLSVSPTG